MKKRLFSAISSGNVSLPARRWQRCKRLLLKNNSSTEEEEIIEFEAEEREESDSEESNIYDILVQGECLVVSKEVRDALLRKEEEEMSPSECISFVNNDFDSKLCEDLVRGFVTSMSKNGVNAEMSATPFLAKKVKVKLLLKWIVGPAVARNRARMLPPLH
ncbi:uncharacterized protein LOC144545979 [Carex rostrata]